MLETVAAASFLGFLVLLVLFTLKKPNGTARIAALQKAPCQLCKCGVPLANLAGPRHHVVSFDGMKPFAVAIVPCDEVERAKMVDVYKPGSGERR